MIFGAVIGAAVVMMAGCNGADAGKSEKVTTVSSETKAGESTTSAAIETTDSGQKNNETTAVESSENKDTKESETASDGGSSEDTSAKHTLSVIKTPEGFEIMEGNTYRSSDAQFSYSVLNGVTKRTIETKLDETALMLSDVDLGLIGDTLYVKGKKDGRFYVAAYRNMGEGGGAGTYSGIEYSSDKEMSGEEVAELLTDEYITVSE